MQHKKATTLCTYDYERILSFYHSIGSLIDRAHPGPKTDRNNGKKESGTAGNRTQGLWLKPPVLCH